MRAGSFRSIGELDDDDSEMPGMRQSYQAAGSEPRFVGRRISLAMPLPPKDDNSDDAGRRREIASMGGKARWADLPQATHEGPLKLGEAVIPAAVLKDKRRVLTQRTGPPISYAICATAAIQVAVAS